jgi:NCS1 family nucleobase:cation symporter-1
MAALKFGDADPTAWMIPLTGTAVGVVILVWVAFANITTISVQAYQVCVAMRQEGVRFLASMRWDVMITIFLGLAVFLLIKPSLIYDNFFQFLYWIGLSYSPVMAYLRRLLPVQAPDADCGAIFDARMAALHFRRGLNIAAYMPWAPASPLRGAVQAGLAVESAPSATLGDRAVLVVAPSSIRPHPAQGEARREGGYTV